MRIVNGEIQIFVGNLAARQVSAAPESTYWKAILPTGALVNPGTAGTLKYTKDFKIATATGEAGSTYTANFGNITAASGVTIPEILYELHLAPAVAFVRGLFSGFICVRVAVSILCIAARNKTGFINQVINNGPFRYGMKTYDFDSLKFATEGLSGGACTVIQDNAALPSFMVPVNQRTNAQLFEGGSQKTHSAFMVDDVEYKRFFMSKFVNCVINGRAYSWPLMDPKAVINYDDSMAACNAKGNGWHLMSIPERAVIDHLIYKSGFVPRGNTQYAGMVSCAT